MLVGRAPRHSILCCLRMGMSTAIVVVLSALALICDVAASSSATVDLSRNYLDSSKTSVRQSEVQLLRAVAAGSAAKVAAALQDGANPNCMGHRKLGFLPPLHLASWKAGEGHAAVVQLLLNAGADPNLMSSATTRDQLEDNRERLFAPPLFYAAGLGVPKKVGSGSVRAAIISLVIKAGGNPNAKTKLTFYTEGSDLMDTPLCVIATAGVQAEAQEALLAGGADPNIGCSVSSDVDGVKRRADANVTPLHIMALASARAGCRALWRNLLAHGADPSVRNEMTKQTALHFGAIRADDDYVADVLESYSKTHADRIPALLQARDYRGRTAYDIAALRPRYVRVEQVLESYGAQHGLSANDLRAATREPDSYDRARAARVDAEAEAAHAKAGGYLWTESTPMDTNECDFDVMDYKDLSVKDFFHNYQLLNRPVALTGNISAEWKSWARWTKSQLVRHYGSVKFMAGPIPYGDVFGRKYKTLSVKDFLKLKSTNESYLEKEPERDSDTEPWILFHTGFASKHRAFKHDFTIPKYFAKQGVDKAQAQFSLGSFGAGAPFHWHTHAFNVVLYGRKRWFVAPPAMHKHLGIFREPNSYDESDAHTGLANSGATTLEWYHNLYANVSQKNGVYSCVQRPGWLFYVPEFWMHATVNLAETIAIAQEFGNSMASTFDTVGLFQYPFAISMEEDADEKSRYKDLVDPALLETMRVRRPPQTRDTMEAERTIDEDEAEQGGEADDDEQRAGGRSGYPSRDTPRGRGGSGYDFDDTPRRRGAGRNGGRREERREPRESSREPREIRSRSRSKISDYPDLDKDEL